MMSDSNLPMTFQDLDIDHLPTPKRQLWSATRCGWAMAVTLLLFFGGIGWWGSVLEIHPVADGRLVADETGELRVEPLAGEDWIYDQPLRVTQAVSGTLASGQRGYLPPVDLRVDGENLRLGAGSDVVADQAFEQEQRVRVIFERISLWELAWKAVSP